MDNPQKYACVDLEVSGFDPKIEEILEIAIKTFEIRDGKICLLEDFETLFKPSKEVSLRILDLTHIEVADLESAPSLESLKPTIQKILQGAILVGHGVFLDASFLIEKGLASIDTKSVDTLEMAQVILPTHHSYNLESLAYLLGYKYKNAHRAMSDVEATIAILESFASIFSALSADTRELLLKSTIASRFLWINILNQIQGEAKPKTASLDPLSTRFSESYTLEGVVKLADLQKPSMFVYPNIQDARAIADALGDLHKVYTSSVFSKARVQEYLEGGGESSDKVLLAAMKILVYLDAQNSKDGNDLNWSMLGREVSTLFSSKSLEVPLEYFLHADYHALNKVIDKKRKLFVLNPSSFISWLEQQVSTTLSWGGVIATLSSIYNPLAGFGEERLKSSVLQAIVDTDLCFSTVLVLLKKYLRLTEGTLEFQDLDPFVKDRIYSAINNFSRRLSNSDLRALPEIQAILGKISLFLSGSTTESVDWLEFSDSRCTFVSKKLSLKEKFKEIRDNFQDLTLVLDWLDQGIQKYLEARLQAPFQQTSLTSQNQHQPLVETSELNSKEMFVDLVARSESGSLWLFSDSAKVKEHYDLILSSSMNSYKGLVQGVHGGPTKIAHNYSWKDNYSLWLSLLSASRLPSKLVSCHTVYIVLDSLEELNTPYIRTISERHIGFADKSEWLGEYYLFQIISALKLVTNYERVCLIKTVSSTFTPALEIIQSSLVAQ